jgi:hypothetical protein
LPDGGFIVAPIANREAGAPERFADGGSRALFRQRKTSRSEGLHPEIVVMRAEAEQLVETIKQSMGLLRRHL